MVHPVVRIPGWRIDPRPPIPHLLQKRVIFVHVRNLAFDGCLLRRFHDLEKLCIIEAPAREAETERTTGIIFPNRDDSERDTCVR